MHLTVPKLRRSLRANSQTEDNMELFTIKFRKNNAVYLIKPEGLFVLPGSRCIAETEHGVDLGIVLKTGLNKEIEIYNKYFNLTYLYKILNEVSLELTVLCVDIAKKYSLPWIPTRPESRRP